MSKGIGGQSPVNITHQMNGIFFPTQKQDLINRAHENNAEQEAVDVLQQMLEQEYETMADVMKARGQVK